MEKISLLCISTQHWPDPKLIHEFKGTTSPFVNHEQLIPLEITVVRHYSCSCYAKYEEQYWNTIYGDRWAIA